MAIDSAEKRKSASGVMGVPLIAGVTPDASKDATWRLQAGWSYGGISASPPPAGVSAELSQTMMCSVGRLM